MQYFDDVPVGEGTRFGEWTITCEEIVEFACKWDP